MCTYVGLIQDHFDMQEMEVDEHANTSCRQGTMQHSLTANWAIDTTSLMLGTLGNFLLDHSLQNLAFDNYNQ